MISVSEKAGVENLRPEIAFAVRVVDEVLTGRGIKVAVLTFGENGVHSRGSLHPKNRAVDIDWPPWKQTPHLGPGIRLEVKAKLGRDYDVVLEDTHLHIEYDPK